jgi:hypothetical protein
MATQTSSTPKAILEATEELVRLFQQPASESHRSGELPHFVRDSLTGESHRELSRPFRAIVADKSLAFCRPEPPMLYPTSEYDAHNLWAQRITANVQHLHMRNNFLYDLCQRMSTRLRNQITCSLYLSQGSGDSFSWHTDEWEVLCVQIHGKKVFDFINGNVVHSSPLTPGHWLRIDPHEKHRAHCSALSMHLSFGRHGKYSTTT